MGKKLEQKEWMLKVEGADGHMLSYGNQCVVLSVTLLDKFRTWHTLIGSGPGTNEPQQRPESTETKHV